MDVVPCEQTRFDIFGHVSNKRVVKYIVRYLSLYICSVRYMFVLFKIILDIETRWF